MIANVWLDQSTGKLGYNIEDDEYHMLGSNVGVDKKTEIDPTQKAAQSDGRSQEPSYLQLLAMNYLFISVKNQRFLAFCKRPWSRFFAGHAGKAFWFSKKVENLLQAIITTTITRNG